MKKIAIIPAYNVEKTVSEVIRNTRKFVNDVMVVNDGSTDHTGTLAEKLGVILLNHPTNLGLGCALRTGFKEALIKGYDIVVTLDSDGQHDPEDIERLIQRLQDNRVDVIIGSRLTNRAEWRNFPRHRLWGNLVLTFVTNLAVGRKVTTDSQSGYRVIKREALKKMNLAGKTMEIASEIIFEAGKNGFKIDEVPIKASYDKEVSNVKALRDISRIIFLLAKKGLRLRWISTGQLPLKTFLARKLNKS